MDQTSTTIIIITTIAGILGVFVLIDLSVLSYIKENSQRLSEIITLQQIYPKPEDQSDLFNIVISYEQNVEYQNFVPYVAIKNYIENHNKDMTELFHIAHKANDLRRRYDETLSKIYEEYPLLKHPIYCSQKYIEKQELEFCNQQIIKYPKYDKIVFSFEFNSKESETQKIICILRFPQFVDMLQKKPITNIDCIKLTKHNNSNQIV